MRRLTPPCGSLCSFLSMAYNHGGKVWKYFTRGKFWRVLFLFLGFKILKVCFFCFGCGGRGVAGSTFYLLNSGGALRRVLQLSIWINNRKDHLVNPRMHCSMASSEVVDLKSVAPGSTRIGWVGTGVMGQAMCGHILAAGYDVSVYSRTQSKTSSLCEKGAILRGSPKLVAQQSDVVFTIVGYPTDVQEVILGKEGILKGLKQGGIIVDMTTSNPSLAQDIFLVAKESSCHAVDAPVSGGDVGARNGTLAIFAGGREEVVKSLGPLFSCMGSVTYMGGAGLGQSTKMANQIVIASTMVGLVEALLFAHKAGLDVTLYLKAIAKGIAGSKSLQLYAARLLKRDLNPGFYVNHFVKDLGIAIEECRHMGLSLPGLALSQQLYVSLQAHGEGNLGTQALVLALERLNNTQLPKIDAEIF